MSGEEQTRFKLRVRYRKQGRLIYLGHLEVIQTVERSVRRAGLPYAVSQGFSPRMRISYTSALPVGTASTCEWYDLLLLEPVPAAQALARLVAATPADLAPDRAGYVDVHEPALTAEVARISYRIVLHAPEGGCLSCAAVRRALDEVRAEGSIPYLRGNKRKVLDLTRLLAGAKVRGAGGRDVELDLDTRSDAGGSLRPEILLQALDLALQGVPAADRRIESSGAPRYASFPRVALVRCGQYLERGDGSLAEPLPDLSGRADPPRSAALGMV